MSDSAEKSPEEPAEKSPEEPAEKSPEEPAEKSPEEPTEKSPEEPTEISPEEPAEKSPEEPAEKSPEEPTEISPEEPAEISPEEPAEKSPEEPAEKSPEEPAEKSPEEPTEKSPEEPAEKSPEEPTEKSTEEPTEKSPEEPAEKSPEEPTEKSPEEPAEKPSEEPAKESAEKSAGELTQNVDTPEAVSEYNTNDPRDILNKNKAEFIKTYLLESVEPPEQLVGSYKSFIDIEKDFLLVDSLPEIAPKEFKWDVLALKCLHINLLDLNPIGTDRSLSMVVLREKMSKELGINVPAEALWEYLEKKWQITKTNCTKPFPIDFEPATKPLTLPTDVMELADAAFEERKSRIKIIRKSPVTSAIVSSNTTNPLESKDTMSSLTDEFSAGLKFGENNYSNVSSSGYSPIETTRTNFSFDSNLSLHGNMKEFPSICYINEETNEASSTGIHVDKVVPINDQVNKETSISNSANKKSKTDCREKEGLSASKHVRGDVRNGFHIVKRAKTQVNKQPGKSSRVNDGASCSTHNEKGRLYREYKPPVKGSKSSQRLANKNLKKK